MPQLDDAFDLAPTYGLVVSGFVIIGRALRRLTVAAPQAERG
jgi:hypothetical protein